MGGTNHVRGGVSLRDARRDDLDQIVEVYNHYVATSHATFDIEPKTVEGRRAWLEGFSPTGPYRLLVAESSGKVVGYAGSSQFRVKPAYSTSVETTIYLDPEFTGRGIGVKLYGALLEYLRGYESVHRAFAGVAVPNPGSIALHEKLGFESVGTFRDVGFKFGKFWSVSWFQTSC